MAMGLKLQEDDDDLAAWSALTRQAGQLPPRVAKCFYDPQSRVWAQLGQVPKEDRGRLLKGFTHQVQKAPSSQSTCKRCGEKIVKDAMRIGYPIKDHRGEYGLVACWLHAACARRGDKAAVTLAMGGDAVLKQKMLGYEDLKQEDRLQLCDDLLKAAEDDAEELSKMTPPAESAPRQLPRAPQPSQLQVDLLPFQAEGLHWLLEREADQETRGGVLADEMGMGKTLQAISVILASQALGPTLVVCPAAAMLQWRNEILRFTQPGSLEVEIYYGFNRKSMNFDGKVNTIVLTTYQTLEADFRKEVNSHKVPCQWCNRLFLPEKLKYHQKYFCGPDAEKTEKQSKTDKKTEAVKTMKIGGQATDIVLNPLNAIRIASTQAARRLVKKTPPSETMQDAAEIMDAQGAASSSDAAPAFMPFPVSVLPEEARASLGFGPLSSGASSPSARGRGKGGRGRGQKRKQPDAEDDQRSSLGKDDSKSNLPDHTKLTPPPKMKFKCKFRLSAQTPDSFKGETSATVPSASSSSGPTWNLSLRKPPQKKVIDLDDQDSDLELMGEVDACTHDEATSHSKGVKKATEPQVDMADALPPRPGNEEEDDRGILDLSSSSLFRTRWARVILDEAHRIKGRTNSTAQAAFALHANVRWCLSGTPIQNRVGELYSIVRFLRFYPYAHYICSKKGCKCTSLHYRFDPQTSRCDCCGHAKMQHRSHFASTVSNPIMKFGFIGAGKVAMEKLRSEVIDRILLRRTKVERQADINLPPLDIKIRRDALSVEERDFYKSMYTSMRTQFDTYVHKGTLLHNYAHVFDLIMRLRQAVDHPYLIVHGSMQTSERGPIPTDSRGDADICALCQDDVDDPAMRVVAQCGHSFHRDCVSEYLEQAPELPTGGIGCPTCFSPLTVNLEEADAEEEDEMCVPLPASKRKPSIMQRIKADQFKSSTKIEALLQEINKMTAANSGSKALVFSQFTNMLELIEFRLKREGISSAKMTGSMPIASRSNIIISFQTDPSLKVLLISLKAGGEGLNLQAADHIFVMDPWWNPAAELQAIQRAHRIGQTRPVHAIRLVASDTIEDKIIELQEKKQSVFDSTIGNSNAALARLTAQDIQFLFQQ